MVLKNHEEQKKLNENGISRRKYQILRPNYLSVVEEDLPGSAKWNRRLASVKLGKEV